MTKIAYHDPPALARTRRELQAANRRAEGLKTQNAKHRSEIRKLNKRLERVADAERVVDLARRLRAAVMDGEGCWGTIEAELFEAVK